MGKIYKCKKCEKTLESKEIEIDLELEKSIKVIPDDVTEVPIIGNHKNCGGEVVVIKN
jgi:tRNA(Ile2) C34 agmatinyltransferase TiaS